MEAVIETQRDLKTTKDQWNDEDGAFAGVSHVPRGGVRITGSGVVLIEQTTPNTAQSNLVGPPMAQGSSPDIGVKVVWDADGEGERELTEFRCTLNPDTGGGQDVQEWLAQPFVRFGSNKGDGTGFDLMPLTPPVRVTESIGAEGEVTFDFTQHDDRPLPSNYPNRTLYVFVWAITALGTPASNVQWRFNTSASRSQNNHVMTGVSVVRDERGFTETDIGDVPICSFRSNTYTQQVVTYSAGGAGTELNMGATPTGIVEAFYHALLPNGTAVTMELDDGVAGFTTVANGQDVTEVGLLAQQSYDAQFTLDPDGSGVLTPTIVRGGVREVARTSLDNLARIEGGGARVDPVDFHSEITEAKLVAIRDGAIDDYQSVIDVLLDTYDPAQITFESLWGHAALARADWMLRDAYRIEDYNPKDTHVEILLVSVMERVKAVLPVYDTVNETRTVLVVSGTLKAAYEQVRDTELALEAQYLGPGIEVTAFTCLKRVEDSDGKRELDALSNLAGGATIASQGQVKHVDLAGDKTISAYFREEDIVLEAADPGYRYRVPEFVVPWRYNTTKEEYDDELRRINLATFDAIDSGRIEAVKLLRDTASRYITTLALATEVARVMVDTKGTGVIQVRFWSHIPYPELEVNDAVAIQQRVFLAKDPYTTSKSYKGVLWMHGIIVDDTDPGSQRFTVWVRSFADIASTATNFIKGGYGIPEVNGLNVILDDLGRASFHAICKNAKSVKMAFALDHYPDDADTRAGTLYGLNAGGMLTSAPFTTTLVIGDTVYVSVFAYEKADGTGREAIASRQASATYVVTPVSLTAYTEGWAATANGAESGANTIDTHNTHLYSNLDNADGTNRKFTAGYTAAFPDAPDDVLATVTLWYRLTDGGSWVEGPAKTYDLGTFVGETMDVEAAITANGDLRLTLTYSDGSTPAAPNRCTVTGLSSAASPPGVAYQAT